MMGGGRESGTGEKAGRDGMEMEKGTEIEIPTNDELRAKTSY